MHKPIILHTLTIFEIINRDFPPFLSLDVEKEIKDRHLSAKNNFDITLEELENMMIWSGKSLWPYNQAFLEFLEKNEEELGIKLFLQKIGRGLINKCHTFFSTGGAFRDIYRGSFGDYFLGEEKIELMNVLVELKKEIRHLTRQAIVSKHKDIYLKRVEYYKNLLSEIERHLTNLVEFREKEKKEKNRLADDLDKFIQAVNHGFAFLGPPIRHEDIFRAKDYFLGRKEERKINPA